MGKALLDLAGVRARLDNEDELVRELAQHYVERAPAQLAAVEAAVESGDPSALEHAAHSFKGALGIFGAEAAVALAQALEDLGRAGQVDGVLVILGQLAALSRQLAFEIAATILGPPP